MFAPKRSNWDPISCLIELLKLNNATAVPIPMLMPMIRKRALPLRRFKLAKAIVLIRIRCDYTAKVPNGGRPQVQLVLGARQPGFFKSSYFDFPDLRP